MRSTRPFFAAYFGMSLVVCILGAQVTGTLRTRTPAASVSTESYKIAPGDVVSLRVFNRPEFTREELIVEPSGTLQAPLLEEEVPAACRTTSELAKELAARYREYLLEPRVEIAVKRYSPQSVFVMGAVAKPGNFELHRPVRLRELLALAGGPAANAGDTVEIIHGDSATRCGTVAAGAESSGEELATVSIRDLLQAGTGTNPYMRAGDLVHVREGQKVYVVGNVHKPSVLELREAATLSQAVAAAGGMLPSTRQGAVHIYRQAPGAPQKIEITVSLADIHRKGAEDIPLQGGDIVDVPVSQAKLALKALLMSAATSAMYYPLIVIR